MLQRAYDVQTVKTNVLKRVTKDQPAVLQSVFGGETLMTKKEVAEACNVSLRTISGWMDKKVIKYRKVGKLVRFVPSEVEQSLDAFAVSRPERKIA